VSAGRVVLLHGLAGSVPMWAQVADLLHDERAVTVPQLPWHAAADPAWAWDAQPWRALDGLYGPDDVVVAHSFASALLLTGLGTGALPTPAGVVLLSPFYRPDARDFRWATLAHYLTDFHLLLAAGLRAASQRDIADDLLADMAVAVRERVGAYGWTRFFEAYLATPSVPVARLGLPAAVVHGGDDDVAPPDDARELAARLPDADLVEIPDAGHFPMLVAPHAVAAAVLALDRRARDARHRPTRPQEVLA